MMKNIFLFGILLLLVVGGCKATKADEVIPYILPENIEIKLYEIVKEKPNNSFCFYLTQKDLSVFEIIVRTDTKKGNFKTVDSFDYIKKSNRKVLINDTFYPLVFMSDYTFGTDMRKTELITLSERKERLKKYETDRTYSEDNLFNVHRSWLISEGYSITFDNKGNIIEE